MKKAKINLRGFPGWHTECVVMSMKKLGIPFDIHCGAIDHIPIHHPNEIAQAEAAFGKNLARFWLHGEFLTLKGGRMGKSEGNIIILEDLIKKGFNPISYRYLCLQTHYRSRLNFSWQALKASQNALNKLYQKIRELKLKVKTETGSLQTRDLYGDCNGICGCIDDPWSPPVCSITACSAQCESDVDCPTHYTCNTDSCLCVPQPYCGDGNKDPGEECDDGINNGQYGYCNADCTGYLVCGNGTVEGPEECDDGNTSSDDFCSYPACKKQAKITVTKTVTNDDGGDLVVGDFSLLVDTTGVTSGVPIYVLVGAHNVSEAGVFGYIATISGDCAETGDITLAWQDDKSCTINNNDIKPSITLVKKVVGGSALPDDFDVSIDHVVKTSGSSNPVTANAAHVIDEEVMVSGYSFTSLAGTSYLGVSCPAALEGTITLKPGDVVTCTITNTFGL